MSMTQKMSIPWDAQFRILIFFVFFHLFSENNGKIGLFWFSKKPLSWENLIKKRAVLKNHTHFLSHTHFENEYDL